MKLSPIDAPVGSLQLRTSDLIKNLDREGLAAQSLSTLTPYEEPYVLDISAPSLSYSIEIACIELMERLGEAGKFLIQDAHLDSRAALERIRILLQKNAKLFQEASMKQEALDLWAFLQRVGSSLLATLYTGVGASLVTAGSPAVGSALIGAGILSAVNLAMQDVKGWDFLAKKLGGDDEESVKRFLQYLPATLHSLTGTSGALLQTQVPLDRLPDLTKILQEGLGYYQGTALVGTNIKKAELSWVESQIGEHEIAIEAQDKQKELLHAWVKELVEVLQSHQSLVKELLETRLQQLESL